MAIKNNSELDAQQLSSKAEHINSHRRRAEFPQPEKTGFHSEQETAASDGGDGSSLNAGDNAPQVRQDTQSPEQESTAEHPAGHGLRGYLSTRYALVTKPGLTLKQRIRFVPGLGYFMAWCNALLRLPRISSLQQQVHQLTARLDQLQQTHHALLHSHDKLNERVAELDAQKIVTRLQRYDALDIGTRLMKLDRMQIARQMKTVNQLMRENQNEDIRKQAREQALLARIDAFERVLKEHDAPLLDAVALSSRHLPATPAASGPGFDQDKFYVEFEALFRGTREDIKERLKAYLPYLAHITAVPGPERLRVIDVGCGRGEWLELMDENDIPAIGIDMNAAMVDACLEQGFAARCDDAIAYLREQAAGSVAAVTGFHIIEHLPFETLIALFDAALHALCPGGVIIFETPNPENLMVGACNFYYDPTHLHPIVPQVAEFMARQRGFSHAEILRLHPYPDNHLLHGGTEVEAAVNKVLFGPQDYAVIGRK